MYVNISKVEHLTDRCPAQATKGSATQCQDYLLFSLWGGGGGGVFLGKVSTCPPLD